MSLKLGEVLRGTRVQLRLPRFDETAFILSLWADPETMAPVGGPIDLTYDEAQARRWYARMVDPGSGTDVYCLILDEASTPIGEVSFHRLDKDTMTVEFNVKVAHTYRGQGYGRDAILTFLDYFFNRFGGRVMVDDLAHDNVAGQQALLACGFEHDPSIEEAFVLRMTQERFRALYGSGDA
jgi:RimJ/RimL family protein N-acetyltransferase